MKRSGDDSSSESQDEHATAHAAVWPSIDRAQQAQLLGLEAKRKTSVMILREEHTHTHTLGPFVQG